eukprot:350583-Chlamydomonas_euryale.AAC.7
MAATRRGTGRAVRAPVAPARRAGVRRAHVQPTAGSQRPAPQRRLLHRPGPTQPTPKRRRAARPRRLRRRCSRRSPAGRRWREGGGSVAR